MLDETVDTMALMIASFGLDQAEQYMRDQGNSSLADKLQKLQIDVGFQHQALSEGFSNVSQLEAGTPETSQQIIDFEPVTHGRLKMLITIQDLLPDGNLKDEIKSLNDDLARSATTASTPAPKLSHPSP